VTRSIIHCSRSLSEGSQSRVSGLGSWWRPERSSLLRADLEAPTGRPPQTISGRPAFFSVAWPLRAMLRQIQQVFEERRPDHSLNDEQTFEPTLFGLFPIACGPGPRRGYHLLGFASWEPGPANRTNTLMALTHRRRGVLIEPAEHTLIILGARQCNRQICFRLGVTSIPVPPPPSIREWFAPVRCHAHHAVVEGCDASLSQQSDIAGDDITKALSGVKFLQAVLS